MLTGASVAVRSAIVAPERAPAKMLTALESTEAEDVFLYRPHYAGIANLSGISDRHLLFFNVGPPVPAERRIGTPSMWSCTVFARGWAGNSRSQIEHGASFPADQQSSSNFRKKGLTVDMARVQGTKPSPRPR
jgi:hypothetical protein